MRRRHLFALLSAFVVLVGCAAPAPTNPTPSGSGPGNPSASFEILQPEERLGPSGLLTLATAADIADDGQAVNRTGTFDPGAPQVVAIANIGSVESDTELVLSWLQLRGKAPPMALFEHRIPVRPGVTAFSTGVSRGMLALGPYRVVAALGEERMSLDWMVAENRPASAGSALGTLTAASSDRPMLAAEEQPTQPEPPSSGPSGTVGGGPDTGHGAGGCSLTVTPHGELSAWFEGTGCRGDSTTFAVGPKGGPLRAVGSVAGDFAHPYGTDPCRVGASDLPHAEMTFAARVERGPDTGLQASTEVRLAADELGPSIFVTAEPAPRTLVFPGEPILLRITVSDGAPIGLGQSGVADIEVTEADGTRIDGRTFPGPRKPCDKEPLRQEIAVVAEVPANPEDIHWIDIGARDFASNVTRLSLAWPTKAIWKGGIHALAFSEAVGPVGVNTCRATWNLPMEIPVERRGPVEARGTGETVLGPTCTLGIQGLPYTTYLEFRVEGTFDGKAFDLRVHPTFLEGAYEPGLYLLWDPSPLTITVPVEGAVAFTNFLYERIEPPDVPVRLEGTLTLQCQDACDPPATEE